MTDGRSQFYFANRFEQPLPLAMQKTRYVVVAIVGERNNLDMFRGNSDAPLGSGGGTAEIVKNLDLADLEAAHHDASP